MELQIEVVNQLSTTLGEDHPSTVAAIANLASFREGRAAVAPCSGANVADKERLRRPLDPSVEAGVDNHVDFRTSHTLP